MELMTLAIPTAITGLTIATNAIKSGGRDYIGIISSLWDRILKEEESFD